MTNTKLAKRLLKVQFSDRQIVKSEDGLYYITITKTGENISKGYETRKVCIAASFRATQTKDAMQDIIQRYRNGECLISLQVECNKSGGFYKKAFIALYGKELTY